MVPFLLYNLIFVFCGVVIIASGPFIIWSHTKKFGKPYFSQDIDLSDLTKQLLLFVR